MAGTEVSEQVPAWGVRQQRVHCNVMGVLTHTGRHGQYATGAQNRETSEEVTAGMGLEQSSPGRSGRRESWAAGPA